MNKTRMITNTNEKFNHKNRKKVKKHRKFRRYKKLRKKLHKEMISIELPLRGVTFLRFFRRRRRFLKRSSVLQEGRYLRFKRRTSKNRTLTRRKWKKFFASLIKIQKSEERTEEEKKIIYMRAKIKEDVKKWLRAKKKLAKKAHKRKKKKRLKLGKLYFRIKLKLRKKKKLKKGFRAYRQRLKRNTNPRFYRSKKKARRLMKVFLKNYYRRINFGLPKRIGKRLLFRRVIKSRKKIRKIRNFLDTIITLQTDDPISENIKFVKKHNPHTFETNPFKSTLLTRKLLRKSLKIHLPTKTKDKMSSILQKELNQIVFIKNKKTKENNSRNFNKLNYNKFRTKIFNYKQRNVTSRPYINPLQNFNKEIFVKILKYLHLQKQNSTIPSYTTMFYLNTFKKKKDKLNLRLGYQGAFNKLMIMSLTLKPVIIRSRKRFNKKKIFKKKRLRYTRFLIKYLKKRLRNHVILVSYKAVLNVQ